MNTFYYFEGSIYETMEEANFAARNYNIKKIDKIQTNKSFAEFEKAFDEAQAEGNSDFDSIEWAK